MRRETIDTNVSAASARGGRGFPALTPLRLVLFNLGLALGYLALAQVGLALAAVGKEVSPIWLPIGLAGAALFVLGPRLAPGVLLGAYVANLLNGYSLAEALGISLGDTLSPLLGALIMRRLVVEPRELIHTVRGIWAMTLAGYGGALVSASAGVAVLRISGAMPASTVGAAWLTWWLGDALGVLIVAPVVLTWWYRETLVHSRAQALELAMVAGCILAVGAYVLAGAAPLSPEQVLYAYMVVPFMVWLGLRFPTQTVAVVNLALTALFIRLILAGYGTQIASGFKPRMEFVHGFLAITAFSALMLAAAVGERRKAQAVLRESEARFRTLTALSSDWYWEQDRDFRLTRIDGHGAGRVGALNALVLGHVPWEVAHFAAEREFWVAQRARQEAHLPFQDCMLPWRDKDGAKHYARLAGEPIVDARGTFAGYRGVGKDVTAEIAAWQAVQVSERRLRTLIDAMPDPVVMKDEAEHWIVCNDAALRVAGLEGAEWRGHTDAELMREAGRDVVRALPWATCGEQRWRDAENCCHCERQHVGPDGVGRVYELVCNALIDVAGRPAGRITLCRDITRLKAAEQAQQRQIDEIRHLNDDLESRVSQRTAALEAANRELEAFSYSVSHDLRSPLRALDGFSQVLEEDYRAQLGPDGADYLRRIRKASQRMGDLIDDLLDLSRISRSQVKRAPIDLAALARQMFDELQDAEPQRRIACEIAPNLAVQADPGLVRVLLDNLLRNAWKFTRETPDARIEIGRAERDGKSMFFVRDNGVGFDMDHAGRLFSPFNRLHAVERFEGSGIGLAIVQRIAQLHGGNVLAESAPERGATFYFTLE